MPHSIELWHFFCDKIVTIEFFISTKEEKISMSQIFVDTSSTPFEPSGFVKILNEHFGFSVTFVENYFEERAKSLEQAILELEKTNHPIRSPETQRKVQERNERTHGPGFNLKMELDSFELNWLIWRTSVRVNFPKNINFTVFNRIALFIYKFDPKLNILFYPDK
ncbi:hypothetical protein [Rubinisphaera italica]|nr:hypothetical protein [Rubinisphaera italica]